MTCLTAILRADAGVVSPGGTRSPVYLARDHIRAILDAAAALDREARVLYGERRAIVATLIFAGVRIGEARRLRWEDVDLAGGAIYIREAKTPAGVRAINLLPVLRHELQLFRRSQDVPDGLLFATRTGRPIDASNVRQRVLAAAVDRADLALRHKGLPPLPAGLTPHAMRRTFASLLFALGEPPPYVMHQMGHTTAAFTLALYAKAMDRREGERAKLVALANGRSTRASPPARPPAPPRLPSARPGGPSCAECPNPAYVSDAFRPKAKTCRQIPQNPATIAPVARIRRAERETNSL